MRWFLSYWMERNGAFFQSSGSGICDMPETQPTSLSALRVSGVYRDLEVPKFPGCALSLWVWESLGLPEFPRITVGGGGRRRSSVQCGFGSEILPWKEAKTTPHPVLAGTHGVTEYWSRRLLRTRASCRVLGRFTCCYDTLHGMLTFPALQESYQNLWLLSWQYFWSEDLALNPRTWARWRSQSRKKTPIFAFERENAPSSAKIK